MKSKPVENRFSAAAAAGLRAFPLQERGKKPLGPWKAFAETPPRPEDLAVWDASPLNVGIVTGAPSGIVVLDVDDEQAQAVVDQLGLPPTPVVETGKGRHYYFKRPAGGIRNSAHIHGLKLDFRGDGGYVVGAGSVHESGRLYTWVVSPEQVPFAELPAEVVNLVGQRQVARRPVTNAAGEILCGGRFARYLQDELSQALEELAPVTEGGRNDALFRVGAKLARHVAAAGVEWGPFAEQLREMAMKIGLDESGTDRTLASCWSSGSEEPTPWMITAREWIYLSHQDVFYHVASGSWLKGQAFNNEFMSQRVAKGTLSNFLLANDFIVTVHDLDYQPATSERLVERDGRTWFNTYKPTDIVAVDGDPSPFIEFLEYLVPDPDEREHLLKMLAFTVRNPGQKLRHALLLRSREQGIGKSMLAAMWGRLVGTSNVRKTTTREVGSDYQGFITETMLVVLEELNWGVGPQGYNNLKELITESVAMVNEKFLKVRKWPNVASWVILTNIAVPIMIEDRDRRFFYIDSPATRRDPSYYREFANWWGEHLGVIRHFLERVDLADFDPFAPPPMTAAKERLIADSRTELLKDLAAVAEDRTGVFNRDIVTLAEIERELGASMRGKTKSQLRSALEQLGAAALGQQRVPGEILGGRPSPHERASLWAIRNASYWQTVSLQERGDEFRRGQGRFAIYADANIDVRPVSEWPGNVAPFYDRKGEPRWGV